MLFRLTPFAHPAADHPLFQKEVRTLSHARDYPSVRHATMLRAAWAAAYAILFAAFYMIYMWFSSTPVFTRGFMVALGMFGQMSALLIGVSLALMLYTDAVCILRASSAVSDDIAAKRWDMLKLAGMSESAFAAVKTGIAQLKVWRLISSIIGIRVVAGCLLVFALTYDESRSVNVAIFASLVAVMLVLTAIFTLEPIRRTHGLTPFGFIILIGLVVSLALLGAALNARSGGISPLLVSSIGIRAETILHAAVYLGLLIFEPIWHAKAVAAITVYASTRIDTGGTAWLFAGFLAFAAWLLEFGLYFVIYSAFLILARVAGMVEQLDGTLFALSVIITFSISLYTVLLLIRRAALRLTTRRLSNMET